MRASNEISAKCCRKQFRASSKRKKREISKRKKIAKSILEQEFLPHELFRTTGREARET
jgi:hypothetical protein